MTVFAFVPSRGASVRIPNKNLAEVGGVSLVARALMCADWAGVDQTIISTDSDAVWDSAYAQRVATAEHRLSLPREQDPGPEASELWRHERPESLAGPHSQIESSISHWLLRCDPVLADDDVIALLQPTSPFRKPETVRRCVELVQSGYDSALTVTLDARRSGRLRSHEDGTLRAIWNAPPGFRPRSQEGGPGRRQPVENGCVYAFSVRHFRATGLRMGGHEAVVPTLWTEALEVDDEFDLAVARALVGVT